MPGLVSSAKEYLATFVKDNSLVKQVVSGLRRLVDGNAGSAVEQLGLHSQSLAKLNSVGGIETTGGVIPALQGSTRQGSLGDGNSLALTTRNSSDVLVTHSSVDGVRNTKHGHDDVSQMGGKGIPAEALGKVSGLSGSSGKSEGITNTQLREVDIYLGGVDGFTTVVAVHLFGRNSCTHRVSMAKSTAHNPTLIPRGGLWLFGCGTRRDGGSRWDEKPNRRLTVKLMPLIHAPSTNTSPPSSS